MILRIIIVYLTLSFCLGVSASTGDEAFGKLPPGEQYRQLSLVLLISGGADRVLTESLLLLTRGQVTSVINPTDYKTPLARIVDQQSMLAGAAYLLRFARDSREEIRLKLATINRNNPVLISLLNRQALAEDAIIIRNAIADSIAYANLPEKAAITAQVLVYRSGTIHLRNMMEYELFSDDLQHLTDEAIFALSGKLDAYQRMFDAEVNTKEFDRKFDAAEYIYNRTSKFDEQAGKLTEEIMKNVILAQSQVDP